MATKSHERLEEGALHHEKCDSCVTDRPAATFVLDDEGKLIVRDRKNSCGTFVWGFSVNVWRTTLCRRSWSP